MSFSQPQTQTTHSKQPTINRSTPPPPSSSDNDLDLEIASLNVNIAYFEADEIHPLRTQVEQDRLETQIHHHLRAIEGLEAQIQHHLSEVERLRRLYKEKEIESMRLRYARRPQQEKTHEESEDGRKKVKRVLDSISGTGKERKRVKKVADSMYGVEEGKGNVDEGTREVLEAVADLVRINMRMRTEAEPKRVNEGANAEK
jgi:hypothetical protein